MPSEAQGEANVSDGPSSAEFRNIEVLLNAAESAVSAARNEFLRLAEEPAPPPAPLAAEFEDDHELLPEGGPWPSGRGSDARGLVVLPGGLSGQPRARGAITRAVHGMARWVVGF